MIKIDNKPDNVLIEKYYKSVVSWFNMTHESFSSNAEALTFRGFINSNLKRIITADFNSLLGIADELYERFPIILESFSSFTFFYNYREIAESIITKLISCNLTTKAGKTAFSEISALAVKKINAVSVNTKSYFLPALISDLKNKTTPAARKEHLLSICDFICGRFMPLIIPDWIMQIPLCFDYKKMDSEILKDLVETLNLKVCPMCNETNIEIINNSKTNTRYRPALDHFLPKSRHPVFSLSIYNLIPVCHTCNSTFKRDQETYLPKHCNPYVGGVDNDIFFCATYFIFDSLYGANSSVKRRIELMASNEALKHNISLFALESIYNRSLPREEVQHILDLCKEYKALSSMMSFEYFKRNFLKFDEAADLSCITYGKLRYDTIKIIEADYLDKM